jgi:hypothetical protein
VEFYKNLVKTIAREPGNHSSSQSCAGISVTLMLNKPHSTCMYVLTLYIISVDVYTILIYTAICSSH